MKRKRMIQLLPQWAINQYGSLTKGNILMAESDISRFMINGVIKYNPLSMEVELLNNNHPVSVVFTEAAKHTHTVWFNVSSKLSYCDDARQYESQGEFNYNFSNLLLWCNQTPWKVTKAKYTRGEFNNIPDEVYKQEEVKMDNVVSGITTFKGDKNIYFTHKVDNRGRIYPDTYLLNYQGDDYQKSCLDINMPYEVSNQGLRFIAHDIANFVGIKGDYKGKEKWVKRNQFRLRVAHNRESTILRIAKEPHMALKAIEAWEAIQQGNRTTTYRCKIDATASGMQLLAIISNSSNLAKYTNLTASDKQYDVYTQYCKGVSANVSPSHYNEVRKIFKKAFMTYYYNSEAVIKRAESKLLQYGIDLQGKLEDLIKSNSYGASEVKDYINSIFCFIDKHLKPKATLQFIEYTMPNGFEVKLPMTKLNKVRLTQFPITIKWRENQYDFESNRRSLVPNIIHSIDAYVCWRVLEQARDNGVRIATIHDCFMVDANHVPDCRQWYENALKEVQSTNLFTKIIRQILTNVKIHLDDKGKQLVDKALMSRGKFEYDYSERTFDIDIVNGYGLS